MSELIEKMRGFKVFFGVPTIDAKVSVPFLMSMLETQEILKNYGIESYVGVIQRDCYVARARNEIAACFLKSGYTHLFFVDSDMGWEPNKVIKVLGRDRDSVFGGYVGKTDDEKKYMLQTFKDDYGKLITENGLIKCFSGPTGFMCIKREVLVQLIEKYPDLEYYVEDEKVHTFFHCGIRGVNGKSQWFGEDIDFCLKWGAIGDSWCEPDIKFWHAGIKVWECNFQEDSDKS